jgi:hypothetical protein
LSFISEREATEGMRPADGPPLPEDVPEREESPAERAERIAAERAHLERMQRAGFALGRPSNEELRRRRGEVL